MGWLRKKIFREKEFVPYTPAPYTPPVLSQGSLKTTHPIDVGPMTDEEFDVVMYEVTERAVDLFIERYLNRRVHLADKGFVERMFDGDTVTISYEIRVDGTSIIQILGRLRGRPEDLR